MSINQLNLSDKESVKKPLSIYVHIPFCNSKCMYCSFVSSVGTDIEKKRYFDSLIKEIKIQSKNYREFYNVSSIYIGGGTPSSLDYYYIRDLLSCIYKNFAVKNTAEITIEINPNAVDKTKIREYVLSGVNRFSIGLQTISPKILKGMGRTHTANDYEKTIETIREFGIRNISTDIIIGYPGQKLSDVKDTINYLIKQDIPHISTYMLQVETGTKLKALVDNGSLGLPDEDETIEMYEYIYKRLTESGYGRYEISNFSKPTFESSHNKVYWNRGDYLGLGLAAHSYIDGTRFANTGDMNEYYAYLEEQGVPPTKYSKELTKEEKEEEMIMLSLRTSEGMDLESYKNEFGENFLTKRKEKIAALIRAGVLILTPTNKLICSNKGFLVLNKIVLELTTD
ncbi:MAG: radical SAM family heme chaperone HemW [Clostridia bacterium]|nr:radical SAM family heme chaperone HemW [Clostridia bacterium]